MPLLVLGSDRPAGSTGRGRRPEDAAAASRYGVSDRHRDHAACRVTPAASATCAQDPPSAKDRAETPRHSPTNALKRKSSENAAGSDRRARASTACRACWARASAVGSGSFGPGGSAASKVLMTPSGSLSSSHRVSQTYVAMNRPARGSRLHHPSGGRPPYIRCRTPFRTQCCEAVDAGRPRPTQ
jgi:hypothetical protein